VFANDPTEAKGSRFIFNLGHGITPETTELIIVAEYSIWFEEYIG